jgi:hypothetical protein
MLKASPIQLKAGVNFTVGYTNFLIINTGCIITIVQFQQAL